jgi:hypothetical protein
MRYWTAIRYTAACAMFVTQGVSAQEIDASLDCLSSPREFIARLADAHDIAPTPMHVSDGSVSAYRPSPRRTLTAFGFKVHAVFASSTGNAASVQQGGGGTAQPVYGAVVMADADTVRRHLQDMGSPATVKEVIPLVMTAVVCAK